MHCVEELNPEALFDLAEIEALPAFDAPDFMPDLPAIAFTFTEAETSSATACTYSVTGVSENPYDGVFCFAQSPFGLCSEDYHWWSDSDMWRSAGAGALQGATAYGKGLAIGAAGAAVVVGGAAVAVTVGVPAAIVSGGLVILGGAGVVTTAGSIINNPSAENISYNIGGLTGAGIVGGASGRYLSSKLSPPNYQPSPGPVTLSAETSMRWIDPNHRNSATAGAVNYLLNFSTANATGPSTIGAASAAAGAGSGVAAGSQLLLK